MDLSRCKLYKITRKRDLYIVLGLMDKNIIEQNTNKYSPYIEVKEKKRLIEPTLYRNSKLGMLQKRVNKLLQQIDYDNYVFSGVKERSYISNGKYHLGCKELFAIDMRKFYPNIHRERVYNFFKYKMLNSSDVANILTNLLTINLKKVDKLDEDVLRFILDNNIKSLNHIPTGVSTSPLLSYLANIDLFEKIRIFSNNNGYKMSVYIDDIVISSTKSINMKNISSIIKMIEKEGYSISKEKLKFYGSNECKRVTGAIISKDGNRLIIPNKIKNKIRTVKSDLTIPIDLKENKLKGLYGIVKQVSKK